MAENVDYVMNTIPQEWRRRWCNAIEPGGGGCACRGCVQIGNRLVMTNLKVTQCDPEHINEAAIPEDIYIKYKVTKQEWMDWIKRNDFRN